MLLCTALWPVMAGILTLAISVHLSTRGSELSQTAQTSGDNMNALGWCSSLPALAAPHPLSSSTLQLASKVLKVTLLVSFSGSVLGKCLFHALVFLTHRQQNLLSQP